MLSYFGGMGLILSIANPHDGVFYIFPMAMYYLRIIVRVLELYQLARTSN